MAVSRLLYLLLVPLLVLVQTRIDARQGTFKAQEDVLYLWSGDQLKAVAPGFEDVLADLYWIRTVQYFGGRWMSSGRRFDVLYALMDIATSLDPRLEVAYSYGAIFLCEPGPDGTGDPASGIRILEKGVRAMPQKWRLQHQLGYFRYLYMNDPKGAARELFEAARKGGGQALANLAEMIVAQSRTDRRTEREIWRRLYEVSEEEFLKESALKALQRLNGLDAIDALHAAVDRFLAVHGRIPRHVRELVQEGVDPRWLVDPTGVALEYDAATGLFWFSPRSRLWSLLGKPTRRPGRG